jgi:hypothetical protein
MTDDEIDEYVRRYLGDRKPTSRYASFDYCFNHFQEYRDGDRLEQLLEPGHLQLACLQLGFFLASWGMYRGGSQLSTHSAKVLEPVVETIVSSPRDAWGLDVDRYDREGIALALELGDRFGSVLPGGWSPTLRSKAMLGVFGCVPAFDRFVNKGLGVSGFRRKSLLLVRDFFDEHADVLDRHRGRTLDFATSTETERRYSQAKVVDMVFFVKGGGSPAVLDRG